mmetsp:Transcript_29698/g.92323  ORF Transcript_29698/g.92323 Transcript_29698/m.92323 type:complete len:359 (-) Transcript_29698:59-1135(-)
MPEQQAQDTPEGLARASAARRTRGLAKAHEAHGCQRQRRRRLSHERCTELCKIHCGPHAVAMCLLQLLHSRALHAVREALAPGRRPSAERHRHALVKGVGGLLSDCAVEDDQARLLRPGFCTGSHHGHPLGSMLEVLSTHEGNEEVLTELRAQALRHGLGAERVGLCSRSRRSCASLCPLAREGGAAKRPAGRRLVLEEAKGHRQLVVGDLFASQKRGCLQPAADGVVTVHDGEGHLVVLQILQLPQQVVNTSPNLGALRGGGALVAGAGRGGADVGQGLPEVLWVVSTECPASVSEHRECQFDAHLGDASVLKDEAHEVEDDTSRQQAETEQKRAESDATPRNARILSRWLSLSLRC